MRVVPVTMATQHPDNASRPFWAQSAFISTQDEIDELLLMFKEFPIDEYMWDWEGKYVDEAVGEKLFSRAKDFFLARPLGRELFLTFRIPAFDGEKMHRMARAFMNILSLTDLARDIGLPHPPVTEMFLPLTTSAKQPLQVLSAFRSVADYHRSVFHETLASERELLEHVDVTPLIEDTDSLFGAASIVRPYWESLLREHPKIADRGQRIFFARSDPALNAGMVPAVLAVKAALSVVATLSTELSMPVFPIIGTGSLPFRGNVNPLSVDQFTALYAGTRTYSIQSAFRYDYSKKEVCASLERLREVVPTLSSQYVADEDRSILNQISTSFSGFWRPTIEAIAADINAVAAYVPARRERLQHIGLFGYSRGIGAVKLPRAIGFTAALYSLGIPPELVATGRGLRGIKERGLLSILEYYYPSLKTDLLQAGRYLNRENLSLLAATSPAYAAIEDDVRAIEETYLCELGPESADEMIHRNLTSTIYQRLHRGGDLVPMKEEIVQAGVLRRSLG